MNGNMHVALLYYFYENFPPPSFREKLRFFYIYLVISDIQPQLLDGQLYLVVHVYRVSHVSIAFASLHRIYEA